MLKTVSTNGRLSKRKDGLYDVWLARYPKDKTKTKPEDKPKTDFAFGMWQYTRTARVPGVSGNVDMSHAYKDYAAIIRRAGLGAVKGV